ncbi:Lipoprotein-releasing system ATP-binding protein LolD 2 [Agrobacterium tumefaciens]|nr:Lipoprotein-releasing system ATP-binding protein LolD 2 [Agrobacterium tumefaciens]
MGNRSRMILFISDVKKTYETAEGVIPVLNGVGLSLDAGESLALTGESGSGKSTLLHLAGGLDLPDSGTIMVSGRKITDLDDRGRAQFRRHDVGLIFQQFNLIPSLDVGSNVSFHAKLAGRHDPTWEKTLVEALGIATLLRRYPEQLSGGQQQRVAIARTLAARPALILADEPTGNLDEATADIVIDIMLRLTKSANIALLLVTHSSRLAAKLDRRITLSGGKVSQ